ncbi:MAG: hypothetical protein FD136_1462 [Chitinophagaceae bacterium]|nr:MAG: hypothetical protein FD136_1462 [Chitinophagaceae bacterium]
MTTIQMKRAEHLLWIVPLLYGIVTNNSAHVDSVFMYYNGVYFTFGFLMVTFFFLVVLIIPFLLHLYLRKLGERQFILSWLHVAISLLLIMAVLFIFSVNLPINTGWRYHIGELTQFSKWEYYNNMAVIITQIFIAIQILFSVYSVGSIIQFHIAKFQERKAVYEYDNTGYDESTDAMAQQMTA